MNAQEKQAFIEANKQPPATAEDPPTTALAAASGSSAVAVVDFGDDAGSGMEGLTRDEFRVPLIRVLQSNSPQCEDPRDGGVPGARPGMIINSATGEMWDGSEGFVFVPVVRDHTFLEFIPRDLGGGFVGQRDVDDDLVLELRAKQGRFGKLYTSDKRTPDGKPAEGTEIAEQYSLYGLIVDDHGFVTRVILPFGSTQIKKYQALISRIDGITYIGPDNKPVKPPLWAHRWRVTTRPESNKKGKFHGWVIALATKNEDGTEAPTVKSLVKRSEPLYAMAKDFHALIKGGQVKADYAAAQDVDQPVGDEEIPM